MDSRIIQSVRLWPLMASFAFVFSLPALGAERCEQWAALLESAEGRVEWQSPPDTAWQSAGTGARFCYGDRVRVLDQRAALRLANDSLVRLQENSLVTLLPEDKGFWFELLEGAGHFLSRTPKQFTIKAPYLNAAVDGTEFVVNAYPRENRVAVLEGDVRVSNGQGEVRLQQDMQTTAAATTALSPVQSIRLRDAAEWVLYFPPLVVQVSAPAQVETLIQREDYGAALAQLTAGALTAERTTLAASLAFHTGKTAQGEQLLADALKMAPGQAEAQALQALRTLMNGDSAGALPQTGQLVQSHPQNPSVLLTHAYAQQSRGNIEEALETNLQAQTLVPGNLFVTARTAELQLSVGNARAAQKLIDQALNQAPQHSRLNTLAGFIALNRFSTDKARDHFQIAIKTDDSEPLARLGLALALIQKGKIEEGRAQMEMAVLLDPGSSLLRSYLGKTYATQNQTDWADTQYQLAKDLDPNDPTPWFYQAHLKHEENRPGEALRLISTAIEKNDNRAVYRSRLLLDSDAAARSANLTGIYDTLGFTETAKNTAALTVAENPMDFASHQALIMAYSDDSEAQVLRAREAQMTRLLAPIGAKELNVGVSESGLQAHPWVSPSRIGANEYTSLFAKRGLNGNVNSFLGTQDSRGYDWQVQAIGNRLSVSGGQYDYQTEGYKTNNDLDIAVAEGNLHYQVTNYLKVYLQSSKTEQRHGDLRSGVYSPLYSESLRISHDAEHHLVGIKADIRSNTTFLGTIVRGSYDSFSSKLNTTSPVLVSTDTESENDHFNFLLTHQIDRHEIQLGLQQEQYDSQGEANLDLYLPGLPAIPLESYTIDERSTMRNLYLNLTTAIEKIDGKLGISREELRDQGRLDRREDMTNYNIGIAYTPTQSTKLEIGQWRDMANRLPDAFSLQKSTLFSFVSANSLSNFAEQRARAIKFSWNNDDTVFLTQAIDSQVDQKIIRGDNEVFSIETDVIDEFNFAINIEHAISDRITVLAGTEIEKSKLQNPKLQENLTQIDTYSNNMGIKYFLSDNIQLSSDAIFISQQTESMLPADDVNPAQPSPEGVIVNAAAEMTDNDKNLRVVIQALNIFNEKIDYRHSKLYYEPEGFSPTQPSWPTERTLLFIFHFQY